MTAKRLFLLLIIFSIFSASAVFAKDRVAVLDFEAKEVKEDDALAVSDLFRSDLVAVGKYTVLERGNMQSILNEHELQLKGIVNEASASEIGELLAVNYLFLGNLSKFGNKYIMVIDKINIETGEIEKSIKKNANTMDDFLELSAEAAVEMSDENVEEFNIGNKNVYEAATITDLVGSVGIFNLFGIKELEIDQQKMQATDQEVRRTIYSEFEKDNALISMIVNALTFGIAGNFMQGFNEYSYLTIGTTGFFILSLLTDSLGFQVLSGALWLSSYAGSYVTPWLYESEYNQYLKDSLYVY